MPRPNKIFLIGFSASGKSTLAPLLAARLDYSLLDTDAEIELREGIPCGRIIHEMGWGYFRSCERAVLEELCADGQRSCVAALGGGAVTIEGVIPLLRKAGLVIWLQVSLEEILARTGTREDRPLLADRSPGEIADILKLREAYYRQAAHQAIDVSRLSPEDAADRVMELIKS